MCSQSAEDIKQLISRYGVGDQLYQELVYLKDFWQNEEVNIGVVGPSRIGKSSHVNAHLGEKRAKVSSTDQCTMGCEMYLHPRNNNIRLWDIPGVNTLDFTRDNYDEKVHLDRYDFFLILTDTIFTLDTKWLADEINSRGKQFFLVRTKLDTAIRDAMDDDEDTTPEEVITGIRESLMKDLGRLGFTESCKVYLVNNRNPKDSRLDFGRLQKDLCESTAATKRYHAMILSLAETSPSVLARKVDFFRNRILSVSVAAASRGTVPIPGIRSPMDCSVILEEVQLYLKGFGLDQASISALEKFTGKRAGEIERTLLAELRLVYPALYQIRTECREEGDMWVKMARKAADMLGPQLSALAASFTASGTGGKEAQMMLTLGISFSTYGLAFLAARSHLGALLEQVYSVACLIHGIPKTQLRQREELFELIEIPDEIM